MRCQQCGLENVPRAEICARCSAILDLPTSPARMRPDLLATTPNPLSDNHDNREAGETILDLKSQPPAALRRRLIPAGPVRRVAPIASVEPSLTDLLSAPGLDPLENPRVHGLGPPELRERAEPETEQMILPEQPGQPWEDVIAQASSALLSRYGTEAEAPTAVQHANEVELLPWHATADPPTGDATLEAKVPDKKSPPEERAKSGLTAGALELPDLAGLWNGRIPIPPAQTAAEDASFTRVEPPMARPAPIDPPRARVAGAPSIPPPAVDARARVAPRPLARTVFRSGEAEPVPGGRLGPAASRPSQPPRPSVAPAPGELQRARRIAPLATLAESARTPIPTGSALPSLPPMPAPWGSGSSLPKMPEPPKFAPAPPPVLAPPPPAIVPPPPVTRLPPAEPTPATRPPVSKPRNPSDSATRGPDNGVRPGFEHPSTRRIPTPDKPPASVSRAPIEPPSVRSAEPHKAPTEPPTAPPTPAVVTARPAIDPPSVRNELPKAPLPPDPPTLRPPIAPRPLPSTPALAKSDAFKPVPLSGSVSVPAFSRDADPTEHNPRYERPPTPDALKLSRAIRAADPPKAPMESATEVPSPIFRSTPPRPIVEPVKVEPSRPNIAPADSELGRAPTALKAPIPAAITSQLVQSLAAEGLEVVFRDDSGPASLGGPTRMGLLSLDVDPPTAPPATALGAAAGTPPDVRGKSAVTVAGRSIEDFETDDAKYEIRAAARALDSLAKDEATGRLKEQVRAVPAKPAARSPWSSLVPRPQEKKRDPSASGPVDHPTNVGALLARDIPLKAELLKELSASDQDELTGNASPHDFAAVPTEDGDEPSAPDFGLRLPPAPRALMASASSHDGTPPSTSASFGSFGRPRTDDLLVSGIRPSNAPPVAFSEGAGNTMLGVLALGDDPEGLEGPSGAGDSTRLAPLDELAGAPPPRAIEPDEPAPQFTHAGVMVFGPLGGLGEPSSGSNKSAPGFASAPDFHDSAPGWDSRSPSSPPSWEVRAESNQPAWPDTLRPPNPPRSAAPASTPAPADPRPPRQEETGLMMLDDLIAPVAVVPPGTPPIAPLPKQQAVEQTAALAAPEPITRTVPGGIRRWIAHLIDLALIAGLVQAAALQGLIGPEWQGFLPHDPLSFAEAIATRPVLLLGLVFVALHLVGGALFTALFAATPGGLLTGLRVVAKKTGKKVGPARALIRAILSVPSLVVGGLGYLWSVVDGHRRALHDVVTGSVVVRRG